MKGKIYGMFMDWLTFAAAAVMFGWVLYEAGRLQ